MQVNKNIENSNAESSQNSSPKSESNQISESTPESANVHGKTTNEATGVAHKTIEKISEGQNVADINLTNKLKNENLLSNHEVKSNTNVENKNNENSNKNKNKEAPPPIVESLGENTEVQNEAEKVASAQEQASERCKSSRNRGSRITAR